MGTGSRMHAAADLRAAPEQVDHAESIAGVASSWFGREEGELGTHTFVTFGRRNASLRRPPHRDRLVELRIRNYGGVTKFGLARPLQRFHQLQPAWQPKRKAKSAQRA